MAVYVTSDAHGHVRALDEALSAASPCAGDELYVLGDLIDRGPDPLGVISLVRSLPNARVLMGNHEQLMLVALAGPGAPHDGAFDLSGLDRDGFLNWTNWMNNGGTTTAAQLEGLSSEDYGDVVSWVGGLGLAASVRVGERTYALTHAGVNPGMLASWAHVMGDVDLNDPETLAQGLKSQPADVLLWIREGFWNVPTGLVDKDGKGPVVVSGHTPSPYLPMYVGADGVSCTTEDGKGQVVKLGATEATGGVADKICIDSAAASGFGVGRVGVLRLDDHAVWYADVREGE